MRAHSALQLSALLLTLSAGVIGFQLSDLRQSLYPTPASIYTALEPSEDFLADTNAFQAESEDSAQSLFVQEPTQRRSHKPSTANILHNSNQRGSFTMLRAFRDAIGENWRGTVELVVEKRRVALGAIVREDGWIITKASQLPPRTELLCRFYDGTEARADSVAVNQELDLALLHVNDDHLPVITWADNDLPTRGRWVATTDTNETPTAVGVVSAGLQNIDQKRSVLGVELESFARGGVLVKKVLRGTGADLAGLKEGDVINAIDSEKLTDREAVFAKLKACYAGQCIMLGIKRGESTFEASAQMMDLTGELQEPTEMEVNGPISARSTGFKGVFMHDTVLHPTQCGGPLVDLDGRVVGINIARAGRVTSYALPASVVRPEIDRLIVEGERKLHAPAGTSVTSTSGPSKVR